MDLSELMFPRIELALWSLARLVHIVGGALAGVVGLCLFALSCAAMHWVSTAQHHLGTFMGHMWATVGQEVVAILLALSWAVVVWGGLWIVGVPREAGLNHLVAWLVVPTVVVWLIAKSYWIRTTWRQLGHLALQVVWLVVVVFACRPYVVVATAIPDVPMSQYYGRLENPNTVMRRLAETAFAVDGFRWYRWNIYNAGSSRMLMYEVASAGSLLDWWHKRRMEWGGVRGIEVDAYEYHARLLRARLRADARGDSPLLDFRVTRLVAIHVVDTWWADDQEAGENLPIVIATFDVN